MFSSSPVLFLFIYKHINVCMCLNKPMNFHIKNTAQHTCYILAKEHSFSLCIALELCLLEIRPMYQMLTQLAFLQQERAKFTRPISSFNLNILPCLKCFLIFFQRSHLIPSRCANHRLSEVAVNCILMFSSNTSIV